MKFLPHRYLFALLFIATCCAAFSCANLFRTFSPPLDDSDLSAYSYAALLECGESEFSLKNFGEALRLFDAAIKKNPRGSKARLYAANTLFAYNALGDAVYAYNEFMKNDVKGVIETLEQPPAPDFSISSSNNIYARVEAYLDDKNGYSVVKGECDGEIGSNHAFANLDIMVANMVLLFSEMLDANRNGQFCDPEDFIILDPLDDVPIINSNIGNVNFKKAIGYVSTNNLGALSYADLTNLYEVARLTHDAIEAALPYLRGAISASRRIYNVIDAGTRVGSRITAGETNIVLSTINDISNFVMTDETFGSFPHILVVGETLNETHKMLTGVYAFPPGSALLYIPSPWETHTGGAKKRLETAITAVEQLAALGVNLNTITDFDDITNALTVNGVPASEISNFISDISVVSNGFNDVEDLINDYLTNGGFGEIWTNN